MTKTAPQMKEAVRTDPILSTMSPKTGEKNIWPMALAATANPYCLTVMDGSSLRGIKMFYLESSRVLLRGRRRRRVEFAKSATLTACKYGHNPVTMIDMPTENISIDAWTVNRDRILLPLACLVSIFRSDDHSTPLFFKSSAA